MSAPTEPAVPDADAQSALLASFASLTGTDTSTARSFLSSANWDLNAAASAFFANSPAAPPTRMSGSHAPRGTRPPAAASSRIASLADLASPSADDEGDSGNDYYAGGEKSGQVVRAPKDDDADGGDLQKKILEKARAEAGRGADPFAGRGAGYRLGETADGGRRGEERRTVEKVLTFYSDGFTVDDGELRRLDDPANKAFLEEVEQGFVPAEMEEPGTAAVSVKLVDKKNEEYVPPKRKVQAFAGEGMRLGGPNASTSPAPVVASNAAPVQVDDSAPQIRLQIRLHDGTRMPARFNETHTVGDLRVFVAQARPGGAVFDLSTTFPRKVLNDDSLTLKDAQLSGAVIVQTLR